MTVLISHAQPAHGSDTTQPGDGVVDGGESDGADVSVGSITAAALAGSEAVRRVAALVTAGVRIPAEQPAYAADVLGQEPPADPGDSSQPDNLHRN